MSVSQQDSDSSQDIRVVVRKACCRTIGDLLDNFLLLYMPDCGNLVCTICIPSPQDETFSAKINLTVVKVFFLNGRRTMGKMFAENVDPENLWSQKDFSFLKPGL